jgi:outer membrane protein OmpA-like peptidoglycan-associated protein
MHAQKADKKAVVMTAREAAQTAEDARLIAAKRRQEEQLANERRLAEEREARAKAEAAAEAQRRSVAEAERASAESAKREADLAKREAQVAADLAERRRADAEADRVIALAERRAAEDAAERARLAAQQAEAQRLEAESLRQRAEDEKRELRAELMRQLNLILETRDTARGLIINVSDVLFDTGRYTLRPGAREKLAKISGIILAHPGLKLEIEGHTDSVGSEEYNQQLSENRAGAVRDYLLQQGISINNLTARGLGETTPVASNETSAGRQQNRRVELVVSGEAIGTTVSRLGIPQ